MLSTAAQFMGAKFSGQDSLFNGVKIDSRSVLPGDLFVAIKGAKVDGHDFIEDAKARGAAGVVVSQSVETGLPTLMVADTIQALGIFAKTYRQLFQIPIVAVTGSCGKTTVKEMIASILSVQGPILATQGNLNTDVGVPLTLLRLETEHQMAVIEMGARQKGDIAYLMGLVSPLVSLITNAGVAHLEIFKTEKSIAEAKGEIFAHLEPDGIAIMNADDKHISYWQELVKNKGPKIITFGLQNQATISCQKLILDKLSSQFELLTDIGMIPIKLSIPGEHSIQNALAAAAVARALGISLGTIQKGLAAFKPVTGRLQAKTGRSGEHIIDDTYNANPVSMRAALSVLAGFSGKKIFVMGDMFELGEGSSEVHEQIGREAKQYGIDKMFGVGEATAFAVKGFGQGATHYSDKSLLLKDLNKILDKNSVVLVKGSRGMRMEEIVNALMEEHQEIKTC